MDCEFCKKFSTKSSLKQHQKYAKYCKEIQCKNDKDFVCISCKKEFTSKQSLSYHTSICVEYKISNNNSNEQIEFLKKELENKEKIINNIKQYQNQLTIYFLGLLADDITSKKDKGKIMHYLNYS